MRQCPDDRDISFEAVLAKVEQQLKSGEDEGEQQETTEVAGTSKMGGVARKAPEVEQAELTGADGSNASSAEEEAPGGVN